MNLLFVAGTRPEVIKLAPVIKKAKERGHTVELAALTQHTDLLDRALDDFCLTPDYEIKVKRKTSELDEFIAKSVGPLSEAMTVWERDWVIIQGDTLSTFMGAFCGFLRKSKVCHVEAGLRTYNLEHPFPEEALRQLTARVTTLNCAPTERAAQALRSESVLGKIAVTGNTVVDAVRMMVDPDKPREKHVLFTMHRRENGDDEQRKILDAMTAWCKENPDWLITWPKHPRMKWKSPVMNFKVIEPVGYRQSLEFIVKSGFVVTDSGGIQEESGILGVPALVCRETTERKESVEAGASVLVGSDPDKLYSEMMKLTDQGYRKKMSVKVKEYGDGLASERIVKEMEDYGR